MKNSKIFPFERNKYYYGKLLSVDDFNLEQKYVCNKLRMSHKYINGMGILTGLYTVQVDEQTISIDSGIALDDSGRELIVAEPVMKKLSLLDGFDQCIQRGESYLYLCLEYLEKELDPVYNMAGNGGLGSTGQEENNKIKESYRLFLTNQEPKNPGDHALNFAEETICLYQRHGILVKQTVPRYVEAGQKVPLEVTIETPPKQYVAFSYELSLDCFSYEKSQTLEIKFDEMLYEKKGKYTFTYDLDSIHTKGLTGSISVKADSFLLSVDGEAKKERMGGKSIIELVDGDVKEKIFQTYYKTSLEGQNVNQEHLYLSKIYLLKNEESYVIDHLENVPFNQYVVNDAIAYSMNKMLYKEVRDLRNQVVSLSKKKSGGKCPNEWSMEESVMHGTYPMHIGFHGDAGKRFVSPPISHGLGLGHVCIILSFETKQDEVVFGDSEVFENKEKSVNVSQVPKISLAAKLDETSGSFIIGAYLKEAVLKEDIIIHWTAFRDTKEPIQERLERKISIKPSMLELNVRESAVLDIHFYNMDDTKLTWIVKENEGFVDETNTYTAPNEKGVYELVARSDSYPEVQASIFAVVRDGEKYDNKKS